MNEISNVLSEIIKREELKEYLIQSVLNKEIKAPLNRSNICIINALKSLKDDLMKEYLNKTQEVLVSIIMPTFNRENEISLAIQSVIKQSYKNWELIIVDDGSNDKTKEVVNAYQNSDDRIIYARNTIRKGVSVARNIGLKYAKGEYIAYLDSDNEWYADYLLLMINVLIENSRFKSIYSSQEIYEYKEKRKIFKGLRFGLFHRALLENRNYIDINAYIHHRKLYEIYGGFDENMTRLVDWELILRYTNESFPYALPCILGCYYYGRNKNQITQDGKFTINYNIIREKLSVNELNIKKVNLLKFNGRPYKFYSNCITTRKNHKINKRISIIIPNYEALSSLNICIEAIEKYTNKNLYKLIIVDNNSSGEVKNYLKTLQDDGRARVIFNNYNMGFTYAINQGIKISDINTDIILMNNDAIVTEGWLEALIEVTKDIYDVGIVAPRQVLPPFTKTNTIHVPFCIDAREIDVNLSQHHNNVLDPFIMPNKGYIGLSFVPFYCVLITRQCINNVGILDYENGRHYNSDRLYCKKVINKGYKIIYTPHSKGYHLLQQSTNELKKNDLYLYKTIFINNNWEDLKNQINNIDI